MEDALVHSGENFTILNNESLNPCCNGRCTRTFKLFRDAKKFAVLILVVMEDALVHIWFSY